MKIKQALAAIKLFMKTRNRKIERAVRIFSTVFFIVVPPVLAFCMFVASARAMAIDGDAINRLTDTLNNDGALAPLVILILFSLLLFRSLFRVMFIAVDWWDRRLRRKKRNARLQIIRQLGQQ